MRNSCFDCSPFNAFIINVIANVFEVPGYPTINIGILLNIPTKKINRFSFNAYVFEIPLIN